MPAATKSKPAAAAAAAAAPTNGTKKVVEEDTDTEDRDEIQDDDDEEEEHAEEVDGDSYVVEAILEHQHKGKKLEYLVKWEGYDDSENTWQTEDTMDCPDLLKAYWKDFDRKKKATSSSSPSKAASKPASKKRSSEAADSSPAPPTKKRGGRPPKAPRPELSEEIDDIEEDDDDDTGAAGSHLDDDDRAEMVRIQNRYRAKKDWSTLVAKVENMEQGNGAGMVAYLLFNGEKMAVPFPVKEANKRCPQQVIAFYESHLQFKTNEPAE